MIVLNSILVYVNLLIQTYKKHIKKENLCGSLFFMQELY